MSRSRKSENKATQKRREWGTPSFEYGCNLCDPATIEQEAREEVQKELDRNAKEQLNEILEEAWYVYFSICSDNTIYIGISNNVKRRIDNHNKGRGAKYTQTRLPIKLVKTIECANRSEALKLERKLKKLTRQQKLDMIEDDQNGRNYTQSRC